MPISPVVQLERLAEEDNMSQPVGLDCPHCRKSIVASFDVSKDTEIKCPHCGSVIVAPSSGGQPFVKK